MALPSTGPISMTQVRTELGLSGAISLGQAEVRALAGRVSGTSISMSHLRGKSAVNWAATPNEAVSIFATNSQSSGMRSAEASIHFNSAGTISGGGYPSINRVGQHGRWDGGDADSSNTQIRFTEVGTGSRNGTVGGDSLNTWHSMSTTRSVSFAVLNSFMGVLESMILRIEMRHNTDDSTIVSAQITLGIQIGIAV